MKRRRTICPVMGYNLKRAGWAREALETFMHTMGLREVDGMDTALEDLLGQEFPLLLGKARRSYREETSRICRTCQRRFDPWSDLRGDALDTCIERDSAAQADDGRRTHQRRP